MNATKFMKFKYFTAHTLINYLKMLAVPMYGVFILYRQVLK